MFFRILKKDLKRKKTMNIIILLFVILATMFVASSVNNILTVTNGLDYYFEKAGLTQDYFIVSRAGFEASHLSDLLASEPSVKSYQAEPQIFVNGDQFTLNGEKAFQFDNIGLILSVEECKLNYFDEHNHVISQVKEGEVYITGPALKNSSVQPGDTLLLDHNGTQLSLTVAGSGKDAALGSDFMGNSRFLVHPNDYAKLMENETVREYFGAKIYYISTDDIAALTEAVSEESGIVFDGDISMIRMTYVMNMIVAGILLVVSAGLILISFTVLRFTISFTISEEFREIGVMKAMGIRNGAIRRLYLTKYLGLALTGAAAGYLLSIPFGSILLASVSESMVLGSENSGFVGLLCAVAVVAIILLFSYSCTGKVNQLTPVDAVRNGQTGERFGKKSILHLGKSRLGTTGFLALNDCLSSPRQFGIITVVFSLCLLLVMILANTANTLCSEKLIPFLGVVYCDVYIIDMESVMRMMNNSAGDSDAGDEIVYEELGALETLLETNGMPAECLTDVSYKYTMSFGGHSMKLSFQQGKGARADEYVYQEGSPPSHENEIALTLPAAEQIGAEIGDTVLIKIGGEEKEYIVTAFYSNMNQMGMYGRLHENVKTNMSEAFSVFGSHVRFTDHPDSREIQRRIEKIKDILKTDKVYTAAEFVNNTTEVSDTIRSVKHLVFLITLIIAALVTVLMERSFIAKEKAEIALMKAMGFRDGKIMAQHTLRFCLVLILADIIAALLCVPLTKLCIDPIFGMMGAVYGVEYQIRPLELFALYPLVMLCVTVLGAFCTSLYTKRITASQTSNIE